MRIDSCQWELFSLKCEAFPAQDCAVTVRSDPTADSVVANLYRHHHRWLAGWLGRRLPSVEQAADLAHDTFVKLLTARDTAALREPRAFLTTLAKRVLANHYRRQQIEQAYLDAIAHLPEAETPSPEVRAVVLETLCELDRRLDELPAPVRRVFLLAQLDGLKYAEIAAQTRLSLTTVKRHMARATLHCYFSAPAV